MGSKFRESTAQAVIAGITEIANSITNLDEAHIGPVFDLTKRLGKAIATIEAPLKAKVRSIVEERGRLFTDAGSKVLDLSGWRLEIRPSGGGLDRDKFFTMLRSKGLKKIEVCDVEKVYTPNKDLINQAIGAKKFTQKEYDACMNETGYSVQSPTKIEEGGNDDE